MKKHGPAAGPPHRPSAAREHDGQVATLRSNVRWCSDGLEFTCWNGEVVRVAFVLDCHDREVIGWTATTAGHLRRDDPRHDGRCVEHASARRVHPIRVQWLTRQRLDLSPPPRPSTSPLALNLDPCFTPVESPESNGVAEAFVKTFKRDYVRVNPIPDAEAALAAIAALDGATTTTSIRIAGSDTAPLGSTSEPCHSLPRVRSDGVNSKSDLHRLGTYVL